MTLLEQDAELAAPCRLPHSCGSGWGSLFLDLQPIATRCGVSGILWVPQPWQWQQQQMKECHPFWSQGYPMPPAFIQKSLIGCPTVVCNGVSPWPQILSLS